VTVAVGAVPSPAAAPATREAVGTEVATEVALHATAWLVVAGLAGLLMALLLLVPEAGRYLAPLGYGRWAAVHLDVALYGWLALPWVGLLLGAYRVDRRARLARTALGAWSAALAAGVVAWLAGRTSGKLFLDWSGAVGWLFAAAQWVLAAVLGIGLAAELRRRRRAGGLGPGERRRVVGLALLLAVLAAMPALLLWAEDGRRYPPIDPTSGGPTGTSLLGSSLGMIALLVVLPRLLGLPARERRAGSWAPAALAAHLLLYLALDHGDRSNRDPAEWAVLGSLLIWAWLVPRELARFEWPAGARRWRCAMLVWGALLMASGVAQFAPPLLDRMKFTHALVAHAHLAMAGFTSALGALLLHVRMGGGDAAEAFADRPAFWTWNGSTALHVAALSAVGALEAADPAAFLRGGATIDALLTVRLVAGAGMLAAASRWLGRLAGGRP
jgi:cytochrome c oxidase cbb3-type subunit 1